MCLYTLCNVSFDYFRRVLLTQGTAQFFVTVYSLWCPQIFIAFNTESFLYDRFNYQNLILIFLWKVKKIIKFGELFFWRYGREAFYFHFFVIYWSCTFVNRSPSLYQTLLLQLLSFIFVWKSCLLKLQNAALSNFYLSFFFKKIELWIECFPYSFLVSLWCLL